MFKGAKLEDGNKEFSITIQKQIGVNVNKMKNIIYSCSAPKYFVSITYLIILSTNEVQSTPLVIIDGFSPITNVVQIMHYNPPGRSFGPAVQHLVVQIDLPLVNRLPW